MSASVSVSRGERMLACQPCRKRKLRCDHHMPCANCTKSHTQCVAGQASQQRRKRRFPERELLERIRRYESLLDQHNVAFDPLHGESTTGPAARPRNSSLERTTRESPVDQTRGEGQERKGNFQTKNVWHAMSQGFRHASHDSDSSQDDVRGSAIRNEWDRFEEDGDSLLFFGPPDDVVHAPIVHPTTVQILQLWQIFLDNVNPLLKVVHASSLQGQVIKFAANPVNASPDFEALLLSIYCVALLSISGDECTGTFAASKHYLLVKFQLGCQCALWKSKFLRSRNRQCLIALFLYLVSARANTSPPALTSMLGIAVRNAYRMGIHSESALAKLSPFEAEMSRRLWWSLVAFDSRIAGIAGSTVVSLDPTWDCRIPLNVSDSELWPQMKGTPSSLNRPGSITDATFVVVRCELANFIRFTSVHLEFSNPILKQIPRPENVSPDAKTLSELSESIEKRYLQHCELENSIQYLTIWSARSFIAKNLLLESHSTLAADFGAAPEPQRDKTTGHAIRALECDTLIMAPLAQRFAWLNHAYFPFPAYLHLTQDLKQRPQQAQASRAWAALDNNFDAWSSQFHSKGPMVPMLAKLVLSAWEGCRATNSEWSEPSSTPRIVTAMLRLRASPPAPDDTTNAGWSEGTGRQHGLRAPVDLELYNSQHHAGSLAMGGAPLLEPYSGFAEPEWSTSWNMWAGWHGWPES